ncbi:MAG TPA: MarR family transcriptional regulator [Terriglobales bacterium]|jgi:DNA-binding MarR family transcriptional regulator|nr:MarR family transcriptional regulator [Terriglobales bacterium]
MLTTKRAAKGKQELVTQVIRDAREYSIGMVGFHQAVGRILGLNVTDMKCLDVMTMKGSATPSQLAEHTGLSSGATTAMIDRLQKAGLVERHPHPKDRRGTVLLLTKQAMQKLPLLFESLGNAMRVLISGYSQKELAVLADFFVRATVLWQKERGKLQP